VSDVIDAYCGAKTRADTRCRRPAGWGTDHAGHGPCKLHLGSTPNHQLAGVVHLARREMGAMGRPLDIDPATALLELIRIAAGEVQWASEKVYELDHDAVFVVDQTTKTRPLSFGKEGESRKKKVREVTTTNEVRLHAWIRVRHEASDRLHAYVKTALANNIAERHVRLAELQGVALATAIRGILTDLRVLNRPETPAIVRRHLAAISARGAGAIAA
jgi:hypothetical protein